MLDELRQVDVSAIAELVRIKEEEQVLADRLSKMEARKEKVSAAVYKRVRADYESRQQALEVQSRPLKDRARKEYARLRALRAEVERGVEETSLAKEELEFRSDLGEFPGEEFRTKLEETEKTLASRKQELAEIDQLKQQFINAFHSEAELDTPAVPPPASREPVRATRPQDDETLVTGSFSTEPAGTAGEKTVAKPARPPEAPQTTIPAAILNPGAPTAKITTPRLIQFVDDKPAEEYALKRGTTSIGRSPRNEIPLPYSEVSRHHADVIFAEDGFRIIDLGSGNGVMVNGKRVKEHPLADGDIIQIGMRRLVYRA